jgi:hypothetical protein
MSNFDGRYPAISFSLRCAVVGGLAMFICMAAGELFVDPEMFRGFLRKPALWPLVFLETTIWLVPFMILIVPLLNRLKTKKPKSAAWIITLSWIAVGLVVAAGYNFAYFSSEWSVSQILRPEITFGWTLPYLVILLLFIYLSLDYLKNIRGLSAQ